MIVKFNGSPDEVNSPYCERNRKICLEWEHYIQSKSGDVRGKYNAWSFIVQGKLGNGWKIELKKSTMSSGNLLLSSEFQNLFVHMVLEKNNLVANTGYFHIKRANFFDVTRSLFITGHQRLGVNRKYHLIAFKETFESAFYRKIESLLSDKIIKSELNEVLYDPNLSQFRISIGSISAEFNLIESIIALVDKE